MRRRSPFIVLLLMMSEDRLGGFHGGQPLSSAAAVTGVVVYILFSSRAAPSHALFFRAWRAGWRPVLGVLRAHDAISSSLHSVKKLPFTIFTTCNAKRPFIMIRYSYYSTFRHLGPTGKKGVSKQKKNTNKKKVASASITRTRRTAQRDFTFAWA